MSPAAPHLRGAGFPEERAMVSTLTAVILALVLSWAATPLARRVAVMVGAVDEPTARRVHTRCVPRLGGLAIVAGFVLPLFILVALGTQIGLMWFSQRSLVVGLLAGGLAIAAVGAWDDTKGMRARHKLAAQVLVASIAWAFGLRLECVTLPYFGHVSFWPLSFLVTIPWFVAIINAVNLIDGLDGLAAGVGFFACVANFITAYLGGYPGNMVICLLAATLAGAIVGFLFHNFHPATIFMGDTGSMFLGFMLAAIPLFGVGTHKGGTALAVMVPLLALGLPIFDMISAMVRRYVARRPIFAPDRSHIHHKLLDKGHSHRSAVLILYGLSLLFTVVALVAYVGRSLEIGFALVACSVVLFIVVRTAGSLPLFGAQPQDPRRAREATVEALRRAVPWALMEMEAASGVDKLRPVLERFAEEAKLVALEVSSAGANGSARVKPWSWAQDAATAQQLREAVVAVFPIQLEGETVELRFRWDSEECAVNPQADMLLQLVVDSAERLLLRRPPPRTRDSRPHGRFSVV
ncbi:glycosyltransferase family 4 protein [Sorangium sp. So ce426]|uniref:glycosyltransferase family 4 protein n=2 Tax=unclassified Sorangium TaxID=2621164 RepID=UPI003F5B905D